jgi:hypothetical protein
LAGIPSLVREGVKFFRAPRSLDDEVLDNFGADPIPETWDPYDGHVDVPNIVNMDDPVWVNVYDRLVSEELMPEELVSQMRADGNSEMYIDAVLVEMEELARRGGNDGAFSNFQDYRLNGNAFEPDVDDPTRPALTTLDETVVVPTPAPAGLINTAEAGFDGVPTQDMHYDQLMQTDMGPQDLVDNMVASGLNPTRITEELVALRHRARDEYLVTGSLFVEELGNELASFIERRQLDLPETVPTQQQLWHDTLEDA